MSYPAVESAETNVQACTMAGALSESAPRAVSVIAVNNTAVDDAGDNRAQVEFPFIHNDR